jgi:hypothetical protein
MSKIKCLFRLLPILPAILLATNLVAQGSFYQFAVSQEGVYKITAEQAAKLGASSVDQLTVYGYPGMIPQELDSSSLQLVEIPVKNIDGELFVYLSAAEQMIPGENGAQFLPHHYTDTLHYLVQTQKQPAKAIPSLPLSPNEVPYEATLYRPVIYKNPEYNLLSSGRDWYGERVFAGESIILNFKEKLSQDLPVYYQGRVMAQSLANSTFDLSINQTTGTAYSIASLPNSTYGVKGRIQEASGRISLRMGSQPQVKLYFQTTDRNGTGYLDYFMLGFPASSTDLPTGIFYNFDQSPFSLESHPNRRIWDVSDFFNAKELRFSGAVGVNVNKIAVFEPGQSPSLSDFQPVTMDLRQSPSFTELIIITHPSMVSQANRLSAYKISTGISSQVVILPEIYAAFGYGNPDVSAIRNFLAFHYLQDNKLENVLLFGKGTFDYKKKLGGRPNLVPTYSSRSSLNPLTTYSSDDYFGFLELGEGFWDETAQGDLSLDIGIGRLPVINIQEAKSVVDKIIQYDASSTAPGGWKRKILFVADDGDNNVHLNDSESLANHLAQHQPELLIEKLYLDSFEQSQPGTIQKSAAAKGTFETSIDSSFLVVNYIGHGNETTLMAEELFTVSDLNNWRESSRLPVFVTATCEFGRHDSPLIRSGAEELLIADRRGAIALLTTGRPVFSNINFALNEAFMQEAFQREEGQSLTLGEIYRRTKNNSLNGPLNRNFSLLGDPSLRLALPELAIQLEELVDINSGIHGDTLLALQPARYRGKVIDPLTGTDVTSYNGNLELLLSAAPLTKETLGDESQPTTFWDDRDFLFRGSVQIEKGLFEGEIILPTAASGSIQEATLRFFAQNNLLTAEAMGAYKISIDSRAAPLAEDHEGPEIILTLKPPFDASSLSSTWIEMKAELADPSGIQIRPEQGISLQINGGLKIPMSDYYRAQNGSFQQGSMDFPVNGLQEGKNTLLFEAFDNQGNRSEQILELWVSGSEKLDILSHLVFPNPADQFAQLRLTHNRPGENLSLSFKIYSLLGSEIFSQSLRFPKADPILDNGGGFFMQGKSNFPAKGTYLYILELQSEADGSSDRKSGKLLIQ